MHTLKYIGYLIIISILLSSCQKETETVISTAMEEQFYLRNGGSDMPVWVHGNAASKVFIITVHGGPGLGYGLDFRRGTFSEALEEKYAMVYWDQRHMGGAHGHLKSDEMSVDHVVDDIYFLLQTLKMKYGQDIRLFLMGHSWGGTVSTAFLQKENYQQEVKGWINIAGTPDILREEVGTIKRIIELANENIASGESMEEWQQILEVVTTIDTSILPLKKGDVIKLFKQEKNAFALLEGGINTPQYRQGEFSSLFSSPAPSPFPLIGTTLSLAFQPFWDEYRNLSLTKDLHKIEIPAMLVFGKYDLGASPAIGQLIYEGIRSTEKTVHTYEHSEHEPFNTEPELFSQQLIEFVEKHK